ncbi:MAG: hypothetical protein PVJ22_11830 [Desulfobacterales bacterium]
MFARRIFIHKILRCLVACFIPMFLTLNAGAIDLPSLKYGKLKRDRDVNRLFQNFTVLSDHTYYICGVGDIPYAIIGIDKKYNLRKGNWKKITLTTPMLRSWVSQMDIIYGYPPYGSAILDNKDNKIGIWYSSKQWTTVIIDEGNQIAILTPETPGFRGGN